MDRRPASRRVSFQRFNCLFGLGEGPIRTIAVGSLPDGSTYGALGSQATDGVIVPGSSHLESYESCRQLKPYRPSQQQACWHSLLYRQLTQNPPPLRSSGTSEI